ncbi:1950_t:CDS:2, partial [Cetraspora pellucida]
IMAEKGVLSRYFLQRLLMHYGKYDPQLIELKISHNTGSADISRIRDLQHKGQVLWVRPSVEAVSQRIKEFADLGFQLSYKVMVDIFILFEPRLENIGTDLIKAFAEVKKDSPENYLNGCLREIQFRQERNQLTWEKSQKISHFISQSNPTEQLAWMQVSFPPNS